MVTPCPTCPTSDRVVGQHFRPGFIGLSDLSDLSDRISKVGGENAIPLASLARRIRGRMDHDEAEARALDEHHAASTTDAPLTPDPLTQGLLRGFHVYRRAHPLRPSSAAVAVGPSTPTAGDTP